MKISAQSFSYIGRVRKRNEDSLFLNREHGVFAVADGVGGLPGGELASQTAMKALESVVEDPSVGRDPAAWVQWMQQAVLAEARRGGYAQGIATTLTLLAFDDEGATLAHVGDSGAFRIRDRQIQTLTEVHNVEHENRARGLPVDETDRYRFAITRCLGMEELVVPQIQRFETHPGDVFLLATDGLTDLLEPAEILRVFLRDPDLDAFLETLRVECFERGAHDNVTAIALRIENS
ncbi:MAG: protein phosphatase 2C domain-containing protein [Opitutaceae bacterium]